MTGCLNRCIIWIIHIILGEKMTKKIYVISDLHGHYDLFIKLLTKIKFDQDDLLYIIGDICDRGPDSLKILFYIMEHDNIILLKGNHEYMMQEALYYGIYYNDFDYPSKALKNWLANGGDTTMANIRDYLKKDKLKYSDYQVVRDAFLKQLYEYLLNLPSYLELEVNGQKYVLVHAGINPRYPLEKQRLHDLLWIRNDFYLARGDLTKIYIFGHTPTALLNDDCSFNVWFDPINENKIGIDGGLACGSIYSQLNCLCLTDERIIVIKQEG